MSGRIFNQYKISTEFMKGDISDFQSPIETIQIDYWIWCGFALIGCSTPKAKESVSDLSWIFRIYPNWIICKRKFHALGIINGGG